MIEAAILVAFLLGVLIGVVLVRERAPWREMRAAAPLVLNEPTTTHVPDRRSTTS